MNKLRKKGKLKEYKEIKQELLESVKQSDALGVDLSKSSGHNNEIIKEILAIYFAILKGQGGKNNRSDSPLLKSVFLGIPKFVQFINIEIVYDLINVLREYLKGEIEVAETGSRVNISNILAALLCTF